MKYYIDTEFLEGTQKEKFPISLFRKEIKPTIDLISIGIVGEDGREYYAISKDFNLKEAWNRFDIKVEQVYGYMRNIYPEGRKYKDYWIRENVLKTIFYEWYCKDINFHNINKYFTYKEFKKLLNKYGKTNKEIAEEIKSFVYSKEDVLYNHERCSINDVGEVKSKIKFYAYYANYDWVAFCWLFGKMLDLPKGFPIYCHDLKQELDRQQFCGEVKGIELNLDLKSHPNYPKQENEHNALDDARWNKKLHEFLKRLEKSFSSK